MHALAYTYIYRRLGFLSQADETKKEPRQQAVYVSRSLYVREA